MALWFLVQKLGGGWWGGGGSGRGEEYGGRGFEKNRGRGGGWWGDEEKGEGEGEKEWEGLS